MKINKITHGFVVQTWDTNLKQWISQEFVAGDLTEYEENGSSIPLDPDDIWPDKEPFLPFLMQQPGEAQLQPVAENAAAISDQVHSNRDRYRRLYRRLGEKLGGFPGVWNFIAECALELARQHPGEWQDGWIEACWTIGDYILAMEDSTTAKELVGLALTSTSKPAKRKTQKKSKEPNTHLFSPHTDVCIYCGKSAEDDAIENTPCRKEGSTSRGG